MIFAENISLKGHIASEHEKNKSFKCATCDMIFAVNICLKGHFSSEHEKKSYKCLLSSWEEEICYFKFMFSSNMTSEIGHM